jgi:hypothetical protein
MMANEPITYASMLSQIGLLIEDTIPDPSEISTVDAVALLVRENNALRTALGLPTYKQLRKLEEEDL